MNFFAETESMRCYQGDTLPLFRVAVTGTEVSNCSMVLQLADAAAPDTAVLVKECQYYSEGTEGFTVRLNSDDTADLAGMYTMLFVLTDGAGKTYKKLVGNLTVIRAPQEVTPA